MYYIKPIPVTNAVLAASSIPEPATGETPWVSGTDYAVGAVVIRVETHKKYECTLKNPDKTIAPENDHDHWLEVGPTNRWAMFDTKISTQSSKRGSIVVTLTPPEISSKIALVGVQGASTTLEVIVDGAVVSTQTADLVDVGVSDWWEYFYLPYSYSMRVIFGEIPTYRTCQLRVTVTAEDGGIAKIGSLVFGRGIDIGETVFGARVGIKDYSTKETDAFGETVIVQRDYSDKMTLDVVVPTMRVEYIRDDFATMRATPTIFVGEDTHKSTITFGMIDSFEIVLSGPAVSDCSLTIEGLT